jgi:threonyl-tRNA synthetase
MKQIIAARDPVRTEVWDRARAIAYYEAANEPFKLELIDRIPEGEPICACIGMATGRICAAARICKTPARCRPMPSS